jgi:hypothetical protein
MHVLLLVNLWWHSASRRVLQVESECVTCLWCQDTDAVWSQSCPRTHCLAQEHHHVASSLNLKWGVGMCYGRCATVTALCHIPRAAHITFTNHTKSSPPAPSPLPLVHPPHTRTCWSGRSCSHRSRRVLVHLSLASSSSSTRRTTSPERVLSTSSSRGEGHAWMDGWMDGWISY